jgi:hypothetical protein
MLKLRERLFILVHKNVYYLNKAFSKIEEPDKKDDQKIPIVLNKKIEFNDKDIILADFEGLNIDSYIKETLITALKITCSKIDQSNRQIKEKFLQAVALLIGEAKDEKLLLQLLEFFKGVILWPNIAT